MTTVAMCAGMAHIAIGIGAESEFRSPMAIVVIGGLMTSTLLSLVFVPDRLQLRGSVRGMARPHGSIASRALRCGEPRP